MSSKADEAIRRIERGARVVAVRESLGLTGDEFAMRINDAAAALGIALAYDKTKVSKIEGGGAKYLPAEDATVIALLDPEKRDVEWLVLGFAMAEARQLTRPFAEVDRAKVAAAESSRSPATSRGAK